VHFLLARRARRFYLVDLPGDQEVSGVRSQDELKREVGFRAAALIEDGMMLGLGTGSTVRYLLEAIAERRGRGELVRIVGVPTSEDTRRRSEALGIPLGDLTAFPRLDLALDGADEVDPTLNLIKGLGGALLREKIVVTAAADFIALVDESKRVDRLGRQAPLPVEIDPFSLGIQLPFLRDLGCDPRLRLGPAGGPLRTDGGHVVVDCYFPEGIDDSHALADRLDSRPGVLEHGLFLDCTSQVLVATPSGCQILSV
jgi:ribose 5-phosphate isomerase A